MAVYREMGFAYAENMEVFDAVLDAIHRDRWSLLSMGLGDAKQIPLKRCHIKSVLGRWNANLHSHKIEEAIDEIIEKTSQDKEGTYVYHCGRESESDVDGRKWDKTFWLYVTKQGSVLYDSNINQYFILKLQEEKL